jgi:hypothetical protein
MPNSLTFAQGIQEFIDSRDSDYVDELGPEGRKEQESTENLVKNVVCYVLASREMIVPNHPIPMKLETLVQAAPDLVADFLNDHYTRQLVGEIDGYVQRTLEFSRLEAERVPSETTNTYLREAVRTYIHGLPQACVALSRAALEQSLKEALGRQRSGDRDTFQKLVDLAVTWKILEKQTARAARDLAKEGDLVLHERPTDLKKAKEVLLGIRGLVQQIYSSNGGY